MILTKEADFKASIYNIGKVKINNLLSRMKELRENILSKNNEEKENLCKKITFRGLTNKLKLTTLKINHHLPLHEQIQAIDPRHKNISSDLKKIIQCQGKN